jgi:hypothetical protein
VTVAKPGWMAGRVNRRSDVDTARVRDSSQGLVWTAETSRGIHLRRTRGPTKILKFSGVLSTLVKSTCIIPESHTCLCRREDAASSWNMKYPVRQVQPRWWGKFP